MLRLLALIVFLCFTNAEPPNLLLHGLEHLRNVEMAMTEHSPVWEQAVFDKENLLDARKIIEIMGESAKLLSEECSQDIGVIAKAIIDFELGALTGNVNLTDFDRQVILPSSF